jgi:DNA-binding NarL/FixJ family response regulator
MIRLFLIEPQRLAREGLRLLVAKTEDLEVVGEAESIEEAAARLPELNADVVIFDLDGLEVTVAEATEMLRAADNRARFVALSSRRSDEAIAQALEAGVLGFTLKEEGFEQVRDAARAAHAGQHHYTRRVRERLANDGETLVPGKTKTRLQLLTPRELQLLRLLASGMSLKNACKSLHVSYKTADKHKVNLMRKLGIHDRVELARYAIRERLIEP